MNNEEARRILAQLAEGIDPITGEVFPDHHVCNEPVVIRALYKAMSALEDPAHDDFLPQKAEQKERCSRANRVNNSKPWTPEEDTYLRHAHRCGATYEQMSAHLLRSPRVIRYRSVFLAWRIARASSDVRSRRLDKSGVDFPGILKRMNCSCRCSAKDAAYRIWRPG